MKVCTKCNLEKELTEFYFRKDNDKHRNDCKACMYLSSKKRREKNSDIQKEYQRKYQKEWRENNFEYNSIYYKELKLKNPDIIKNYKKKWYENNPEYNSIYSKEWRENNLGYDVNYRKNRKKTDSLFKLTQSIRERVCQSFRYKSFRKNNKTAIVLGCSFNELKSYFEDKFEPWMTWDNKGLYNGEFNFGWDIDHIIPLATAKTEEDVYKLNHYTNLQPLCSKVNRDIKKDNH